MKRLADDPRAPAELRAMIAAARSDGPGPAALERMLAWVERGGPPPRPGAGRLVLIAGGAGIAILFGVLLLRGRGGGDDEPPAVRAPDPPAVPAPAPVVSTLPDDETPPAPAAPAKRAERRAPARTAAPEAKAPEAMAPAPERPSEVALVERARAALTAGDWRGALAAAGEHAQSYPDGVLSEEREAIAVEALAGDGQAGAARARLARFVRRFPGSSYRRHLEQRLGP